jgi:hypothetical protein
MVNGIFKRQKLEELLQHNWGDFLDHLLLMRQVLEDVRNTPFRELMQQNIPPRQVKFSVTKFSSLPANSQQLNSDSNYAFEFWVEYTIPKDDGVVVGTNTYLLSLDGNLKLGESFGTHFRPESS